MAWYEAFLLMIGLICGLMAFGIPVAFAFFAVNIVGLIVFQGGREVERLMGARSKSAYRARFDAMLEAAQQTA